MGALWYTLCDSLPFGQDECKEVGEEYIPELIAELKKDLDDPKAICQALGLCPAQKTRVLSHYFGIEDDLEVCKTFMNKISEQAGSYKTLCNTLGYLTSTISTTSSVIF